MTRIEELIEDLATQAAPPTRMVAGQLYEAGRRRHRWRRRAQMGTMVMGGVAALGVWATSLAGLGPADVPRWGESPAGPPGQAMGGVVWAGVADPTHLYATVMDCDAAGKCSGRLLGSDDGGRVWTVRSTQVLPEVVRLIGTQTLVTWKNPGAEARTGEMPKGYDIIRPLLSTDGGRTWSEMAKSTTPSAFMPTGSLLECYHDDDAAVPGTFKAYVVDIGARQVAPLSAQPGLASAGCEREIPGLWYTGWDPSTPNRRPAVAYSNDSGRSWITHTFDCDCDRLTLFSNDGKTVYAATMLRADSSAGNATAAPPSWDGLRMFRSLDSGATWQPFTLPPPPVPAPEGRIMASTLSLLADGTFAAHDPTADKVGDARWILRNGGWERPNIVGLPDTFYREPKAVPGGYLVYGPSGTGSYDIHRSTDWFTWTRIPVR